MVSDHPRWESKPLRTPKAPLLISRQQSCRTLASTQVILFFKGKIYFPSNSSLILLIFEEIHRSSYEGYFKSLCGIFYRAKMKDTIRHFIQNVTFAKRHKANLQGPAILLTTPHSNTSVDQSFQGFHRWPTNFKRKTILLLVVDRLS